MDSPNREPAATGQATNPQPLALSPHTTAVAPQQSKPKLNISDSAAQALLITNNLQARQHPKSKLPNKLLIAAAALIAFAILVAYLLAAYKPGGSSKSSGGLGLPSQSDSTSTSGVSNQVNQDVKACSNPVNAALTC